MDKREPPTTLQAVEPLEISALEESPSSLLEDSSELLEPTPEMPVKASEPLVVDNKPQALTAGSPPVAASDPPEEESVAVAASEPAIEEAIAVPKSQHLNRQQLGKYFGKSHETIRQWEADGKLAEKGWEVVPGTGSSPKNPRLYRPAAHANQPPQLR